MKTMILVGALWASAATAGPIYWDEETYGNVDGHVFNFDVGTNIVRGTACILRGTNDGCGLQNNSTDPFSFVVAQGQALLNASFSLLGFDAVNATPYVFQGNLWDASGNFSAVDLLTGTGTFTNILDRTGLFAASAGTTFGFSNPAILMYSYEFDFDVACQRGKCKAPHGKTLSGDRLADAVITIPEPGTLSLLAAGLLALGWLRKRSHE